ncbi:hypothetical protein KY339_01090 [Candidatus Woesearchaeota archaeon]|nr:hypothetical protein [Candidatus Woesearchaeota archaeon]
MKMKKIKEMWETIFQNPKKIGGKKYESSVYYHLCQLYQGLGADGLAG